MSHVPSTSPRVSPVSCHGSTCSSTLLRPTPVVPNTTNTNTNTAASSTSKGQGPTPAPATLGLQFFSPRCVLAFTRHFSTVYLAGPYQLNGADVDEDCRDALQALTEVRASPYIVTSRGLYERC